MPSAGRSKSSQAQAHSLISATPSVDKKAGRGAGRLPQSRRSRTDVCLWPLGHWRGPGEQKKLDEAVLALRKSIELDPELVYGYFSLGQVLYDQKKLGESFEAFQKAVEVDPKAVAAVHARIVEMRKAQDFGEFRDREDFKRLNAAIEARGYRSSAIKTHKKGDLPKLNGNTQQLYSHCRTTTALRCVWPFYAWQWRIETAMKQFVEKCLNDLLTRRIRSPSAGPCKFA